MLQSKKVIIGLCELNLILRLDWRDLLPPIEPSPALVWMSCILAIRCLNPFTDLEDKFNLVFKLVFWFHFPGCSAVIVSWTNRKPIFFSGIQGTRFCFVVLFGYFISFILTQKKGIFPLFLGLFPRKKVNETAKEQQSCWGRWAKMLLENTDTVFQGFAENPHLFLRFFAEITESKSVSRFSGVPRKETGFWAELLEDITLNWIWI